MANLLKGATGDWEMVIGLEVHAQVTSEAKLFSGAPTTFGAEPNTQVSLVEHCLVTGVSRLGGLQITEVRGNANITYAVEDMALHGCFWH